MAKRAKARIATGLLTSDGTAVNKLENIWRSRDLALKGILGIQRNECLFVPVKEGAGKVWYHFLNGTADENFVPFDPKIGQEDALIVSGFSFNADNTQAQLDGTKWRISDVPFTLQTPISYPIDPVSSGQFRADIIYVDFTGQSFYVKGTEGGTAVAPDLEYKQVLVTTIFVSDADVTETPAPIPVSDGETLFGASDPLNTLGKNGDTYIQQTAGTFWKKEAGVWNLKYTITATPTLKTVNGNSLLGTGNITIAGGGTNLGWFHVETYGAVHNGTTDDTASIQAAINACNAAGGGTIYFPKGIYVIGGALQSPSGSQLTIPFNSHANSTTNTHIKLLGEVAPNFFSNPLSGGLPPNTGVIFKSTLSGAGKVISSVNVYGGGVLDFNFCHLEMENITVRVKSKSGSTNIAPEATAIDGYALAYLTLNSVRVDTESEHSTTVQPATTAQGIICPFTNNFVFVHLDKVLVYGFYEGITLYECASLSNVFVDCCYVGIHLKASTHAAYMSRSFISRCRTSIKVTGSIGFYFNVGLEAMRTGTAWNKNVYDLEEVGYNSEGTIIYNRVLAGTGRENTVFNRAAYSEPSNIITLSVGETQKKLVSGTTIKTVNGFSLLGSGNVTITASPIQIFDVVLLSTGWVLTSGYYRYDYANTDVTVKSVVDFVPQNASVNIVKAAEILPLTTSIEDHVYLYAVNAPTGNITVNVTITESL